MNKYKKNRKMVKVLSIASWVLPTIAISVLLVIFFVTKVDISKAKKIGLGLTISTLILLVGMGVYKLHLSDVNKKLRSEYLEGMNQKEIIIRSDNDASISIDGVPIGDCFKDQQMIITVGEEDKNIEFINRFNRRRPIRKSIESMEGNNCLHWHRMRFTTTTEEIPEPVEENIEEIEGDEL